MMHLAFDWLQWLQRNGLEPLAYPDEARYLAGLAHDACHALLNLGVTPVEEVYVTLFQLGSLGWDWEAVDPKLDEAPLAYAYWLKGTEAPDWLKQFNAAYSVLQIL